MIGRRHDGHGDQVAEEDAEGCECRQQVMRSVALTGDEAALHAVKRLLCGHQIKPTDQGLGKENIKARQNSYRE